MRLVEDSASVIAVRREMVRHDTEDIEVPAYLWNLIEDVIHNLSYLLVGYDVYVVEDAHRLLELVDLTRIRAQGVVELDLFGLYLVELSSDGRLENK